MPISFRPDQPAEIAFVAVLAGWLGFGVILALGKRGAAPGAAKRDWKSGAGFLLQSAAYAICFVFARTYFSAIRPMSQLAEEILAGITIAIVVASVWFCYAAARALGKQWALVARVIEGHELIATGPYAIVRNPIYLAMLGMYVASALAVTRWPAAIIGLLVFLLGTAIRIRTEENLLRANFGASFVDYARRVPAFLPRFFA
ncbi:MAG TPA: isoprenylcysteine carboxylmethyltransferase family protein [Candidatus Acidoferrales bacterium]|jgi:protein-S-isoprenylcysteine O-methyltransferase Ste14|nr:isoprenylcysteine carboxylmethyltransferase family protein [Candidatus Acidoferrales bacterium]